MCLAAPLAHLRLERRLEIDALTLPSRLLGTEGPPFARRLSGLVAVGLVNNDGEALARLGRYLLETTGNCKVVTTTCRPSRWPP